MGMLQRISSVAAVAPLRADAQSLQQSHYQAFFAGDDISPWAIQLQSAGMNVTPELAMTLSAYYCGVTMIAYDLATSPCEIFKWRPDGGKDRVRGGFYSNAGGIGSLVYKLRWQPNAVQTATEYYTAMIYQWLMRDVAYAEIIGGQDGFLDQLLPRHPDRVRPQRLPSGQMRYKLTEANGEPRYLTQPEMHVWRGVSLDIGATMLSRSMASAQAVAVAASAERAAARFFKSGMTAAVVASYTGEMEDEEEDALHRAISRYGAGVDNSFGVLVVPDDVKLTNLGIEPEKAQMMLAREWGVREIARYLRMPGSKLGIKDSVAYASQYQSAIDYVVGCLRQTAVVIEQSQQRDLILAKDAYFTAFNLAALLRGDPAQQAEFYQKMIEARVFRPSEVRLELNYNPDPALDKLSEGDYRAGKAGESAPTKRGTEQPAGGRAQLKAMLAFHANAVRCLRRERAAVEKMAVRFASDVDGWRQGLREFYADHADFVAQQMRLPLALARGYAAQHGSEFEACGVAVVAGEAGEAWERYEADELAALALSDGNEADDFFARRLTDARAGAQTTVPVTVRLDAPITVAPGAVHVEAPVTNRVDVQPAAPAQVAVDARTHVDGAQITVQPAAAPRVTVPVTVHQPARRTEVHIAETMRQTKVQRGSDGEIEGSTSVTRAKVRVKDKKE